MMKRILFLIIMFCLLSCTTGKTKIDTYSADENFKLIKKNIYYKTIVDSSIAFFRENNINYEETVFNEYLPVALKFQQMLIDRDINAVINIFISEQEIIELLHTWEGYKKTHYKNINEFKTYWISDIKNNTQIVALDIDLFSITSAKPEWGKYLWYISPNSYFNKKNELIHSFTLSIHTGYNDPGKPKFYIYKFDKIKGVYVLTAGDAFNPGDDYMFDDYHHDGE